MKNHSFSLSLCLLLSCVIVVVAQEVRQPEAAQNTQPPAVEKASIHGTVTKAGTSQPMKGVQVSLRRSNAAQNGRAGALLGAVNGQAGLGALLGNFGAAIGVSATTDSMGQFTFTDVTPGQYQITAEREGYIHAEFGQKTVTGSGTAVTLTPAQSLTADLQMFQSGLISGRVRDEYGEAVAQASVQAMAYQYANGQQTMVPAGSTETTDLGEYRLHSLPPGEYFVTVIPRAESAGIGAGGGQRGGLPAGLPGAAGLLGQGLVPGGGPLPIYYPGTLDSRQAAPVPLALSEEVRGIDFNIRSVRAATVSGHVVAPFSLRPQQPGGLQGARGGVQAGAAGAAGIQNLLQTLQAAQGVQVNMSRVGAQAGTAGLAGLGLGGTRVGADGAFQMQNVAPGLYNLTATAKDPAGKDFSGRIRIEVGANNITDVSLALRPVVELHGKVALDSPPQGFDMSKLRISLVSEDSALGGVADLLATLGDNAPAGRGGGGLPAGLSDFLPGGQIVSAPVAADGSFLLKGVGASEYRIRMTSLQGLQGGYVSTARIGTSDAINAPFTVITETETLQVQLGFSGKSVSGKVLDGKGAAYSAAITALVPDELHRGRPDLYFSMASDRDGRFTFTNVPPGNYKLIAWEEIPSGASQNPDFIWRFEDRSQSVSVDKNGVDNAEVILIPAVR